MSLSEDFARHRKVFELLTASGKADDGTPPYAKKKLEPHDYTEPAVVPAKQNPLTQTGDAPKNTYSLKRGSNASTGMALCFEAPAALEYPRLDTAPPSTYSDPLEPFYHKLEVESRLESQLLCEEEF